MNYRPKGRAALSRSTSVKPPALPEVSDMKWACSVENISVRFASPNGDIGYPKLFMGCQRAHAKQAQQAVNNFAGKVVSLALAITKAFFASTLIGRGPVLPVSR